MYQSSANYFGVMQETAGILVDEVSAASERNLNYMRSVWEIIGRSNGTSFIRSNFEKAEAFVALTAGEIETNLRTSLDVTEKLIAQGKKLQTHSYESAREMADKAIVNAKSVVEATSERVESFTNGVEQQFAEAKKKNKPE